MKKLTAIVVSATMVMGLAACGTPTPTTPTTPATTTKTGTGKGYGGDVKVTLTMNGDKITKVEAVGEKETPNIGSKAITEMPAKFVEKNSADVDVVAGATVTSRGLIYAVKNAMDPTANPWPIPASTGGNGSVTASSVFQGFGMSANARTGPGKDDKDTQVWSINEVFADVLFDGDGRILDIFIDQVEVATPNYDGDGMPHFSGFPGQGGYNNDENHDEKVDGKTPDTEEYFKSEIAAWKTKRERGDAYKVGISTWHEQMDAFQKLFVGKTVAEIEDWAKKYTSDVNGRPLKAESTAEGDKAKYDKLTAAEKAELAEVLTSATMSINDSHGNMIAAIKDAYANKRGLTIKEAAKSGFGTNFMPRVGPGKDDKDTQVYSINQVFATALFDASGKILSLHVDQLEVATPNYDGDGMPHLSGFPGQGGYNNDENHDEKVDGKTPDTEEYFKSEVAAWKMKRARGDAYKVGISTWHEQMDAFQKLFVGKTVAEIEDWAKKYTSDVNGRPLKAESTVEGDKAKYDKLTAAEKAELAEVITSATMSVNDAHGNIISAIKKSWENARNINLTVK